MRLTERLVCDLIFLLLKERLYSIYIMLHQDLHTSQHFIIEDWTETVILQRFMI